ncbi:MAG TPA: hypothetical protein PLO31_07950 [Dysgonamonadaceae bacterium]|jgi:hypothetical protein|nr:hypothetical protein [Weeksellaceae bacterium]HOV72124.1 hypothetical protein [Dysgonamonadaceae bacterium]
MSTKKLPVEFRLDEIKTEEFAIIEEAFDEHKEKLSYSFTTNFAILKERRILCDISFKFLQENIPFIKIKVACIFYVSEKSWNSCIDKENNQIIFQKKFLDHLVVLTLGTLRGVLHAKTEGTKFNRFFVPTINVAEINKDIKTFSFQLQNNTQ